MRLEKVKVNHRAEYPGHRSFRKFVRKVSCEHPDTQRIERVRCAPITKWHVKIYAGDICNEPKLSEHNNHHRRHMCRPNDMIWYDI